jgi:hypothetical protein
MSYTTFPLFISFFLLLSSLPSPSHAKSDSEYADEQNQLTCLVYSSLNFFDIRSLQNKTGNYYITDSSGDTYYFNLCSYTIATSTQSSSCTSNSSVYAYKNSSAGVCTDLTDN